MNKIKENILKPGISLFVSNAKNDKNTDFFINKFILKNKSIPSELDIICPLSYEELIEYLIRVKNKIVYVDAVIQQLYHQSYSEDCDGFKSIMSKSKLIRQINDIVHNNDMCLILKSHTYTQLNKFNSRPNIIGMPKDIVYQSSFIGEIDGNKLNIHKFRYINSGSYDISSLLVKLNRQFKLKKIDENRR